MSFNNIDELDSLHVDVLKELGNIGSGNAVTSLSSLLNREIQINVPNVRILGFNEVAQFVGGPENLIVGLLIKISGDINGMIMYVFDKDFISNVLEIFFDSKLEDILHLSEMERSAFCEIGNIMAGAYVNALSSMTGLKINISSPEICVDMAGAILSVPSIEFAKIGDKVLFIDDSFGVGSNHKIVKSNMILVPEIDSLHLLFERLGVC